jgi:tripartite ATP-independent transporter DctM subunit
MIDAVGEILAILLFLSLCVTIVLGFPVAFTLAGISLIFAFIGAAIGHFDLSILTGLPSRYFGVMLNEVLVSVPLFIFMGMILERSGIAEGLLTTMGQLFGRVRGGLGFSVIFVGALLAASTGVVGATVVTMGLISLPAMLRAKYDPRLATGVICASATLAQIIPPSTVLIFVSDILQGVNAQAQLQMAAEKGAFVQPTTVSVGDLFAGAIIPGLILVGLYALYMAFQAAFYKDRAPALVMTDEDREGLPWRVVTSLVFPLLLIAIVLGSILMGVATATESASLGAIGAMIFAAMKRKLNFGLIREATLATASTSSMIFVILLGASVFSVVFRGLGGEHLVEEALRALPGGLFWAMFVTMFVMFILGFFLDTFEIIFIMLPIFGPALIKLGADPIWLGVMIGVNLQTSFLTPPFGFTLFYMRGVAAASVTTKQIWAGVVPFVIIQLIGLSIIAYEPRLATWLPDLIFRSGVQVDAPNAGTPGSSTQDLLLMPTDPGGGVPAIPGLETNGGDAPMPPLPGQAPAQ